MHGHTRQGNGIGALGAAAIADALALNTTVTIVQHEFESSRTTPAVQGDYGVELVELPAR
jgi:hypothetical protein